VLLLAGAFLEKNQQHLGIKKLRLDAGAKKALQDYHWPGNVRELEHLLSRVALKAATRGNRQSGIVTLSAAYLDIAPDSPEGSSSALADVSIASAPPMDFKGAVDEFQRRLVQQQIALHQGNRAAAARALGLDRGNFHRLLKRLAI
jgi:anaerobic nitric oxide reductase transcription regulator